MKKIAGIYGWKIRHDGGAARQLSPKEDRDHREICKATGIPYIPSIQVMRQDEVESMLNRGWGLKIMNPLPGQAVA